MVALAALAPSISHVLDGGGSAGHARHRARHAHARASALVRSPACVPARLNRSALLDGAVTVSPLPGSRDASPQTQLSFLGVPASELSGVSATGSRSGRHAGRLAAYSQGDGASFLPSRPFTPGETVAVRARLDREGRQTPLAYSFTVSVPNTGGEAGGSARPAPRPRDYQAFRSRPDLRPPTVTVTAHAPAATPGDIFVGPYSGPGQYGPMILDEDGALVWFKALPRGTRAADVRVQSWEGREVLTWWQDPLVANGSRKAGIVIDDGAYRQVAIVRAGNGYQPDLHEFQITPRGTGLITVFSGIRCDLHGVGGPAGGAVADTQVQELDLKTGLVTYEWHSLDHVALGAAYVAPHPGSAKEPFDYFHINSIDVERDGHLLVDARNTWAVYDVDPRTGTVSWQLGGKRSSFELGPGTVTAFQHDAREGANGNLTFFDNGATPKAHPQSRAIEVALDRGARRATLVRRLEHAPPLVSGSQGNLQALADGDWMVGWGQEPYLTEYGPSGQILFDAHMPSGYESYRVYRLPWHGQPGGAPAIAYLGGRQPVLYASWNGATEVASWRVLAGASASTMKPIATVPRQGFETAIALAGRDVAPGGLVEAQALSAGGELLGSSRPART